MTSTRKLAWAAAAVVLLLFFCYVRTAEYAPTALVFLGLLSLLHLFVGRREAALDGLAMAGAAWQLPPRVGWFRVAYRSGGEEGSPGLDVVVDLPSGAVIETAEP